MRVGMGMHIALFVVVPVRVNQVRFLENPHVA
jgi:hypothetical protein